MGEKETERNEVLKRIERLRVDRNWSEYELSKNSSFPQSTINNWYRRNLEPTIRSLRKICIGFGISMSDFFSESDERIQPTPEQKEILELWARLSPKQRETTKQMIKSYIGE